MYSLRVINIHIGTDDFFQSDFPHPFAYGREYIPHRYDFSSAFASIKPVYPLTNPKDLIKSKCVSNTPISHNPWIHREQHGLLVRLIMLNGFNGSHNRFNVVPEAKQSIEIHIDEMYKNLTNSEKLLLIRILEDYVARLKKELKIKKFSNMKDIQGAICDDVDLYKLPRQSIAAMASLARYEIPANMRKKLSMSKETKKLNKAKLSSSNKK